MTWRERSGEAANEKGKIYRERQERGMRMQTREGRDGKELEKYKGKKDGGCDGDYTRKEGSKERDKAEEMKDANKGDGEGWEGA